MTMKEKMEDLDRWFESNEDWSLEEIEERLKQAYEINKKVLETLYDFL